MSGLDLDAYKGLCEARAKALELERCVRDGETDTVFARPGNGHVLNIIVCGFNVTAQEFSLMRRERPGQNERQLFSSMSMGWNRLSRRYFQ